MKLSEMKLGDKALVKDIQTEETHFDYLRDMGFTVGSRIKLLVNLPFGGNFIVLSNYGKYSIQKKLAQKIEVQRL